MNFVIIMSDLLIALVAATPFSWKFFKKNIACFFRFFYLFWITTGLNWMFPTTFEELEYFARGYFFKAVFTTGYVFPVCFVETSFDMIFTDINCIYLFAIQKEKKQKNELKIDIKVFFTHLFTRLDFSLSFYQVSIIPTTVKFYPERIDWITQRILRTVAYFEPKKFQTQFDKKYQFW